MSTGNTFSSTDDFFSSLTVMSRVAQSLSTPSALMPSQLPITNSVSCACIVLLSGYFESYLKDVVREYIEEVNSLGKPIANIPISMQLKHYSGGADALAWASKKDRNLRTTLLSQDLTRRLGSLNVSAGYSLAWEAFANTKSNPGSETVAAILSGLEIEKGWVAINDLISTHGRLDVFLNSFIEMRNVCAHTGRHSTPPSGADISDYVEKFRALAECIDMLAGLRLGEFS